MLTTIHEEKGRQALFIEKKQKALSSLLDVAKIQSTQSSNRIEGIFTSDQRLAAIVQEKAEPINRNEIAIAGYRDVLAMVHDNFDHIPLSSNVILQLHRDLYRFSPSSIGGIFKDSDNIIQERDAMGHSFVRFQPLSAYETPDAVRRLCDDYNRTVKESSVDDLLFTFFLSLTSCVFIRSTMGTAG